MDRSSSPANFAMAVSANPHSLTLRTNPPFAGPKSTYASEVTLCRGCIRRLAIFVYRHSAHPVETTIPYVFDAIRRPAGRRSAPSTIIV